MTLALLHDPPADEAPRETAVDFVRAFERRKELVRQGFALLREANFTAPKDERFDDPTRAIEGLEREAWGDIAERFELQRVMSVAAHRAFWEQINKGGMPPIAVESVLGFVRGIRAQLPNMHRQAVLEVYEWLRPHEWSPVHRLKTNTELEIGRKVVLSSMVDCDQWDGEIRVRIGSGYASDSRLRLLALERVLRALDGRGMVATDDFSDVQMAIEGRVRTDGYAKKDRYRAKPVGETEFFRYRACKNGNLHLEFKRLDLLAKFNAIAGGKTLKPEAGVTKSPRSTKATRKPRPAPTGAKELAFFETPAALADRLVELAEIRDGDDVLEPSAGLGALVRAVSRAGHPCAITCVEIDPGRAAALRADHRTVIEADFLALDPRAEFDAIVANPPFTGGADADHIEAMLGWLKPGGSLVAVASAGIAFRSDHRTVELREAIARLGGTIEALPDDSFAPATHVRTCLVDIPRRS